jgi:hypothetical protein
MLTTNLGVPWIHRASVLAVLAVVRLVQFDLEAVAESLLKIYGRSH